MCQRKKNPLVNHQKCEYKFDNVPTQKSPGPPRGHGGPFSEHPYTIPLLTIRNVNVNSIKGRGGALIRTPIYYLLEPTLTHQSQKHYVISPSQKGCFIRQFAFISTPFLGRQSYLSGDKLIPTILSMLLRSLLPFRTRSSKMNVAPWLR